MKKFVVITILFSSLTFVSLAKKDINAWKQEKSLEQQYDVFKENLNFWDGNYFLKGSQLDDFYGALSDTISGLEKQLAGSHNKINEQKQELANKQQLIDETQAKLDESKKLQDSITVLGIDINKTVYSTVMYLFILGVLVLAGFVYLLFKKSNKVTRETKKEYNELKAEYEDHKKQALDRYTKINMELHKTRMELQKK
ncbi:hypothetical protein [Maribellus mangrovi]|uniref:hypothetical protein n=1 Tax=Maribellus mangrovi TaxID=3133146 RepID=UPI0030EC3890